MKLKSMFRVFVTLRIQSLAHRKKHGFFLRGSNAYVHDPSPSTLCWGSLCHIWGCDELRSLYFCTISEGFMFLTHLDKPERVIPFTCCQPPFGLIVGKWAKGPKVCIYRVHQTLTPLKNTQPFHMRLTFANVTSFCLFWGSDCWEVGRWECHRAIDSICGWLKTRCTRSAWVAWKPLTAGRDRALDLLGFLRSNKTESKNESLFFCFSGMVFWGQKFLVSASWSPHDLTNFWVDHFFFCITMCKETTEGGPSGCRRPFFDFLWRWIWFVVGFTSPSTLGLNPQVVPSLDTLDSLNRMSWMEFFVMFRRRT